MSEKRVRLACIASGSGTDFNSIATAWKNGWIPEVEEVVLISTKEGAGCLEKADKLGIKTHIILPVNKELPLVDLDNEGSEILKWADLVFLVGCIVRIPVPLIRACAPTRHVAIYNIHPAEPHEHGGQGMYGLAVHEHVLSQIRDQIRRGMKSDEDRFYTYPTVHEVIEEYDQGNPLLQGSVKISNNIITELIQGEGKNIKDLAEKLQKHVLPYEWQMLPCAVRMAAKKILDERS